ncbi:MAG: hypothetical protein HY508_05900 [Acidobacteria bacterium]|nr:hypothetical protein [Acidobacteriota bacterium]
MAIDSGNAKLRASVNGAIVGVSTWDYPTISRCFSYHGATTKDFDLKLEIKIDDRVDSGSQYRSPVGVPFSWITPGGAPTNPRRLMTGPQADFWPDKSVYTG